MIGNKILGIAIVFLFSGVAVAMPEKPAPQEPTRIESVVAAEVVKAPAPEPTPVVAPVEPPKKTGCDLAYDYNWPQQTAYAVCMAESTGNPASIGDTNTAYVSCGLMQIRTLPGRPSCAQLQDPQFNMQYAYNMWVGQGFKPWSAYTTGKYTRYL